MQQENFINRLREKDETAFKALVAEYQDSVFNTIMGFVQNQTDAEDLSQEVFIKILHSIGQFRGASSLKTWIYRIAVSKCLDFLRSKKRKNRYAVITQLFNSGKKPGVEPTDLIHPGILNENKEDARILLKTMESLPENQRIAFLLNKIEGLSYKEIAAILLISEPAVDSLLQRAKQNLRKKLKNL